MKGDIERIREDKVSGCQEEKNEEGTKEGWMT